MLATFILDHGYDLYKKNDLKFSEGIYKLLRKEFEYNPVLQCQQFLTDKGFAKRKIQFVVKCLKLGVAKHNELIKKKKLENQSKVSWNETNLAKKMEQAIKKKTKKQSMPNKKIKITKPSKPIKAKKMSPIPIEVSMQHNNEEESMNDSLTADEIRRVLPQPTVIHKAQEEESEDEHKETEEEEKATELEEMTPNADNIVQQQQIESVNQSMQIPQHSYEFGHIFSYFLCFLSSEFVI